MPRKKDKEHRRLGGQACQTESKTIAQRDGGHTMDPVSITSGPAQVIASGIVTAFNGNPVVVKLRENPDTHLEIVFQFVADTADSKSRLDANIVNASTLVLKLYNFNGALPIGTVRAINVGTWESRALFLHFRVYALHESDPTLQYTFYAGPLEAKGG